MKSLKMAKNKANTRSAVLWVIIFTHNVRIGQTVSGASLARSRHVSVGVLASSDPSAPAYETKKKGTPLVRSTRAYMYSKASKKSSRVTLVHTFCMSLQDISRST